MALKFTRDKATKTLTSIPGWAESYNASSGGSATEAYKSSAWAFRSVGIRADAIASAPLKLYDGQDEEIEEHPVLDLLSQVNEEWNKGDLWRYTESAFCVYGCAYWEKVKAGERIVQIQYLNPANVQLELNTKGIQGFKQTSTQKTWPRKDVVYFRGGYDPGSDLQGIAPLSMAALAAKGEKNADQFMQAFFDNFAVPPLLLTTDQPVTDDLITKIKDWWNRQFRGSLNQGKVGVVGSGLKPVQLSSNLKDMAFDTTRSEMHRTVCVALGVDELLLSASGAADRTPVDAALYHLYTTTIIPRWSYYQEVLDAELLSEYPDLVKRDAYFEFDQSEVKPLQNDQNAWAQTLAVLVEKGIIKRDVAAIELGYTAADVPAEPPVQQQPGGFGPGLMSTDLDKWQRKAIKAIKAGKDPAVEFYSDQIPEDLHDQVMDDLARCRSEAQISEVFRSARQDPDQDGSKDSGYKALARSLDQAARVLARSMEWDGKAHSIDGHAI